MIKGSKMRLVYDSGIYRLVPRIKEVDGPPTAADVDFPGQLFIMRKRDPDPFGLVTSPAGIGISGELVLNITSPDGTEREVIAGNTNTIDLRANIAVAVMGGNAAFTAGWFIRLHSSSSLSSSSLIQSIVTGNPTRSAAVVTLPAVAPQQVTNSGNPRVRAAQIVRPSIGGAVTRMASITNLNIQLETGSQVNASWRWTFTGLATAIINQDMAAFASGVGSPSFDLSDGFGQYSISPRSGSRYTWENHNGPPTRVGNIITYAAPNAVLHATQQRTVTFWRISRTNSLTDNRLSEFVSPQPENLTVSPGARYTGGWKIEVI